MSFVISKEQLVNGVKNEMLYCVDCNYCLNYTENKDDNKYCRKCGLGYYNFEYDSVAIMRIIDQSYNGTPIIDYHEKQAVIDCVREILGNKPYFEEDTDYWRKTPDKAVDKFANEIVDFMSAFSKLMQKYATDYKQRIEYELFEYYADFYAIDKHTIAVVFKDGSHTIVPYGKYFGKDFIGYMKYVYENRVNEPFNTHDATYTGSFTGCSSAFEFPSGYCACLTKFTEAYHNFMWNMKNFIHNSWFREMVNENKEMFSKTVQRYWK